MTTKVDLECLYCGHKWVQAFYTKASMDACTCPRCNDSSLKIKEHKSETEDVFGYNK